MWRLREEALREIFGRLDVDGAEIIAVHLQPNENAWLLGLVAARGQQLLTQPVMGLVGARGVAATLSNTSSGSAAPTPSRCGSCDQPDCSRPRPRPQAAGRLSEAGYRRPSTSKRHLAELHGRVPLPKQLIYIERVAGWQVVPSLEPN